MIYEFTAVIVHDGGGFAAFVEELPNTVARGATEDEALAALRVEADLTLAANRAMTHDAFKSQRVVKREVMKVRA